MERYSVFLDRENIAKMAILMKVLNGFNTIPIKIPMIFLIEIEKAIMKFIWKKIQSRITKTIVSAMSEAEGITISDVKLLYRLIVTKMA